MDTVGPTPAQKVEIYLSTARTIQDLKKVVTPKRFLELCGGKRVEEMDQTIAAKVAEHLTKLSDYFFDFCNITKGALEQNQIQAVANPTVVAELIVPQIIDRLSRDEWPPTSI